METVSTEDIALPDPVLISLEAFGEALLGAGCALAFVVFCSLLLSAIVFRPIHEAMKYPLMGTRYNIADVVVLLVQMQVGAAIVFAFPSAARSVPASRLAIGILLIISLGFWWFAGVRMLGRAQITNPQMRCWFLGLVVPLGFTLTVLSLWLPFAGIATVCILFLACTWGYWELLVAVIPVVSLASAHVVGIMICRRACKLIANNGRADPEAMSPSSLPLR